MARERAWPSVVLPTPGTPSMSRCPRAKMLTRARRTTSSLPRITRRSAFSNSAAFWKMATCDGALAISGDIVFDSTIALRGGGVTGVLGTSYQLSAVSSQPSALSLKQIPPLRFALDRNDKFFLWDSRLFIERNCSPYLQPFLADSSYCINSAGLPVRRSMRLAIGG